MEKYKNKILSISGEPVSGKSTTVNKLIELLKEEGYLEKNIHLISTGNKFREYFNSIIQFIRDFMGNKKELNIENKEELQTFFNNAEYRKTLSKTIINLIKTNATLNEFTIQDANNRTDFKGIRQIVDTVIDTDIKNLGEEINKEEHKEEVWIIDSRLAFNNIPESFSVRLTTNPKVAGERLFLDETRGIEDSKYKTVEEAIKEREKRRKGELSRYIEKYGVNLEDENNYDLVIDTSYSSVEDIAKVVLECEECYNKKEEFGRKWAHPMMFLPLQRECDTLAAGQSNMSLENMIHKIDKEGYNPSESIKTVKVDGNYYIIDGHHRNFASAYLDKTLVPYEVLAENDEYYYEGTHITARQRVNALSLNYLHGHESFFDTDTNKFSYKKIFPEIFEKFQNDIEK